MNRRLFSNKLNGVKLSQQLTTLARILQILSIVLAILIFLLGLIFGIVIIANSATSDNYYPNNYDAYYNTTTYTQTSDNSGFGLFLIFGSIFLSAYTLVFYYVLALLLKSAAAVVLHTYISALDTDKIADNTTPRES